MTSLTQTRLRVDIRAALQKLWNPRIYNVEHSWYVGRGAWRREYGTDSDRWAHIESHTRIYRDEYSNHVDVYFAWHPSCSTSRRRSYLEFIGAHGNMVEDMLQLFGSNEDVADGQAEPEDIYEDEEYDEGKEITRTFIKRARNRDFWIKVVVTRIEEMREVEGEYYEYNEEYN